MLDANGNLADSLVESDGSGNITADVTGDLTGNADTATALATSRNFSITGDITAAAIGFTGTGNVALNASIDAGAVNTAELADFAVTGIKLNTMTAGSEKISYWQGAALPAVGAFPAYNKIVECRAGQTGTVTVGRTHDSANMYTAIYKNGSLAVAGVTGAGAKTSNVAVVEGDLIQIYGNCSTDGCTGDTISDIWVGVTNGIGVIGDWYA